MWVLTGRLEEATTRLVKLQKKAARYGDPFTFAVVETKLVKVDKRTTLHYSRFELSHTNRVQVGDYVFLARIEHTAHSNIIDKAGATVEVAESWRDAPCTCEHCNVSRARNCTYLVQHGDRVVQVGRSCLRDYLGTDTPESILHRFTLQREFKLMEEDELGMGFGGVVGHSAVEVLAVTNAALRLWGWVPVSGRSETDTRTPTSFRIGNYLNPPLRPHDDTKALKEALCDNDYEEAHAAIEWFGSNGDNSDYAHNVRTVLKSHWIEPKRRSLAASAMQQYRRQVLDVAPKATKAPQAESKYVGKVGERLRSVTLTVMTRSRHDSDFGAYTLLGMVDAEGNAFLTKSSPLENCYAGHVVRVDGTVKKHGAWRGQPQTELTRVALLEVVKC
jgi:hypothetical protein